MNKNIILILLIYSLIGCGGGSSINMEGVMADFPESKYLTAKGSGKTEGEARDSAKAELTGIFESRVESEVSSKVTSLVEASGSETVTRDAEQSVRVSSSLELKGLQVGKVWQDRKEGTFYALAVLDRAKARRNWQAELANIDREISAKVDALPERESAFNKLQVLKDVKNFWLERLVIAARLEVLGYQPSSVDWHDMSAVIKEAERIKAHTTFFVDISGDRTDEFRRYFFEALTDSGMVISDSADKATLLLKGVVSVESVDLDNPRWKFARAKVSLNIIDTTLDLTVGEINENKRSAHLNHDEALNKAVVTVSKEAAKKLLEYFE